MNNMDKALVCVFVKEIQMFVNGLGGNRGLK